MLVFNGLDIPFKKLTKFAYLDGYNLLCNLLLDI